MSSTEEKNEQAKDGIVNPHRNDVLSGRGNFVNNHSGNEYFRSLVRMHKVAYVATPKSQKPKYSRLIVDTVKGLDPPGRFLKQDNKTKLWHEIDDKKALDKTRQALREGAPDIAKVLDGDDDAPASPQDGGNSGGGGQERNNTTAPQPTSVRCSDSHIAPIVRQQPESGAPTYTVGTNPSVMAPNVPVSTSFNQDPHHHLVSPHSSLASSEYTLPCQNHSGGTNAQNYPGETSNSFQTNYSRPVTSNSFHQNYPVEVSNSLQNHSYHGGETSNLAQQAYAGEVSNSVQQNYAEQATSSVQRNYSGGSSCSAQQNFSTRESSSQNILGETPVSFQHQHSYHGETANTVQHNYIRDASTSVQHNYQGEAFASVRHSFPGEASNPVPPNYLEQAAISLQQNYREAPKSAPQQPPLQQQQQQTQQPPPQQQQQQTQEPPPQQKQPQQQVAAQPDEPQPSQDTQQGSHRGAVPNGERRSSRRGMTRTHSLSLDDVGLMRNSVTGSTMNMSMDESGLSAMFQDSLKFSESTDFHEGEGGDRPRRSMMESDSGMSFASLIDFDDAYNPSFRVIDEKD